jgi:C-terminal processing protease CtpA/Prc
MSKWIVSIFAAALLVQTGGPQNLNFESGEVGGAPVGWITPTPSFTSVIRKDGVSNGKRSVELSSPQQANTPFGNVMQSVDAASYRGKQVRFRAAVRVEGVGVQAQLWFRVDRQGGQMGFFDNMGERAIQSRNWQYYDIIADVESDAQRINFGMMLVRSGSAWISDVSLEILGDTPTPFIEAAHPLSSRGLRNETVFARMFGYVRYFHPSDEAAHMDWEAFALRGARDIESAQDDAELARRLLTLFQPIAPTLRITNAEQTYSQPAELKAASRDSRITYWKHFGVGASSNVTNLYRSDRVQERASTDERSKAPLPAAPFKADFGSGLIAWIPLALYVDEKGTLPHAPNALSSPSSAGALRSTLTVADRGTRFADVIIAWNVFQHFYPYFDVVHTEWLPELTKALQTAATDPDEATFTKTLQRLVAALHDGHGAVGKLAPATTLPLSWDWVEGALVVTAVRSPQAGSLAVGDVVLKIDGQSAADALADREALISGATPQWIRYRALQDLLRGLPGATVNLEVSSERDPGKPMLLTLRYSTDAMPVEETRPAKLTELEPGIYYVDISRITDADFQAALPQLNKARGIVFDFRGYPSNLGPSFLTHLSNKPLTSAQWHVPWVLRPDREDLQFERRGEWNLQPTPPLLEAKKAFIVDGRAISYAESCLGIIEAYKLGAIVGAPSAGTNGNVNPFRLPGGYTIAWTGMKVLKHDGSQHHGIGINPTIPVSRTRAGITSGNDEFLERAVLAVKN